MEERYLSNTIECDKSNTRPVYKLLPGTEDGEAYFVYGGGKNKRIEN